MFELTDAKAGIGLCHLVFPPWTEPRNSPTGNHHLIFKAPIVSTKDGCHFGREDDEL